MTDIGGYIYRSVDYARYSYHTLADFDFPISDLWLTCLKRLYNYFAMKYCCFERTLCRLFQKRRYARCALNLISTFLLYI